MSSAPPFFRPNLVRFSLYIWLTIAMFAVVIVCFVVYVRAEKRIDTANEVRVQSMALSEELRRSSDDLTRMVRTYVATGQPIFKHHYQEILNIRDGKAPRPLDYQNIYWDLVTPDNQRPSPMGPAVAFLKLLQQAGCTEAEFAKLAQSKARSDALARIEFAAMALLESSRPISAEHQTKALALLTNDAYQVAKAEIMRPISEFNSMVATRTLHAVREAQAHAATMRTVLVALALATLALLWRTSKSLLAIMGGSVNDVFTSIERLGSGDFSGAISVAKSKESSVLGWLRATQQNLARLDAQRQQAEDAVRQSEKRFHQALDDMLEGYMLIGFDWTILYVNEVGARYAQLERDELIAHKLTEVYPGIEQTDIFALYQRVMQERVPLRHELMFQFPNGSVNWFELCVTPTQEGISSLGLNITERRQLAQRLEMANAQLERQVVERTADLQTALDAARQASAAKSTFLSGMSHELRTPMNAILGFSQLLQMQAMPEKQKSMVAEIFRAGQHLLALIDDLLDLTRVEAGKVPLTIAPVALADVVNEALSLTQEHLHAMHIELVNGCTTQARVLADAVRLRQVVVNLLSNAAKYNREHGRITIEAVPCKGHRMRLSINDTGEGISAEQLPLLFRTFERLGAERSGIQGSGIGLALSKQLTELMGGEMGVSSAVGAGSTFWIELPLAQADTSADANALQTIEDVQAPSPLKALYIEDNPANLKVVEAMFALRPHWQLATAEDGPSGLALAMQEPLDIILLDIHLPGMNGYEALKTLQADDRTRTVRVIALSADAMPDQVELGLQAGFYCYLSKPLNLQHLLTMLDVLANQITQN